MPELPECLTIQSQLNNSMPIEIKSVSRSNVSDSIIHTKVENLKGKKILRVERKGKMLDLRLSDGRHILSHLGMTGTWLISPTKITEKHTHLQFMGTHKTKTIYLAYVDPRRFGHMYFYDEEMAQKKLAELGHDLKSKDFDYKYFKKSVLKYPNRFIKVSLLDQSLFAGSGNYIANEICARGKVLPNRLISSLKEREIKSLYQAVEDTLEGTIESGGTTFAGGYRDTTGDTGGGVKHLVVFYQKICQMCKKTEVSKITLAQRGTYFCPRCQK